MTTAREHRQPAATTMQRAAAVIAPATEASARSAPGTAARGRIAPATEARNRIALATNTRGRIAPATDAGGRRWPSASSVVYDRAGLAGLSAGGAFFEQDDAEAFAGAVNAPATDAGSRTAPATEARGRIAPAPEAGSRTAPATEAGHRIARGTAGTMAAGLTVTGRAAGPIEAYVDGRLGVRR
ncbi:hypothetical protein ACQP00_04740 [Dactylosporangium sp. CS-047395]|uniref:hypothetical protein n=1 Tax=Dactylosporangium sp. CS-047395 TaxID=3239936 RepID=UPI003D94A7A8